MGFIGSAIKLGVARRVWNEVRKPQNQARARQLFDKATGKSAGTTTRSSRTAR
jgi:hypothetical protein